MNNQTNAYFVMFINIYFVTCSCKFSLIAQLSVNKSQIYLSFDICKLTIFFTETTFSSFKIVITFYFEKVICIDDYKIVKYALLKVIYFGEHLI